MPGMHKGEAYYYVDRRNKIKNDRHWDENGFASESKMEPYYRDIFIEAYGDCDAKCSGCERGLWALRWVIHHRDGDHFNNDPSNLEALCRSCHAAEHHTGRKDSPETIEKRRTASMAAIALLDKTEWRERARLVGLSLKDVKKHDGFGELQSQAQFTSRMRECLECGMQTNAGTMARHQNASGHSGVIKLYGDSSS